MCSLSFSVDHIPTSHTSGEGRQESGGGVRKVGPIEQGMSIPHLTKHKINLGEHSSQNQLEAIGELIRTVSLLCREDMWSHPQNSDRHVAQSLWRQ